jgi:hypothetical protein
MWLLEIFAVSAFALVPNLYSSPRHRATVPVNQSGYQLIETNKNKRYRGTKFFKRLNIR